MNKNYLTYLIIAIIFVVPLILIIPVGFIILLALIPLIPYIISMEFLYKIREYGFLFGKNGNKEKYQKENDDGAILNLKENMFSSKIYCFGVILIILVSVGIIISLDGFALGFAQIAVILIGGSSLMSIGRTRK